MRTLTIGKEEYTIEFSIEASLHKDCTEKVTCLMAGVAEAQSKENIKALISSMADIPQTTLHMLHAGLLEHREDWSIKDTKNLIKQYLIERKGQEDGNYYSLMEYLIEIMAEDGFFEMIGLDKMFQPEEKEQKKSQDHKKKSNEKVIEK